MSELIALKVAELTGDLDRIHKCEADLLARYPNATRCRCGSYAIDKAVFKNGTNAPDNLYQCVRCATEYVPA